MTLVPRLGESSDDVRGLGAFMHMTPAMGRWRVAIVDAAVAWREASLGRLPMILFRNVVLPALAVVAVIRDGKATVYMADDPETQRSHALLWIAVFPASPTYPNGLKYIFDESPRVTEGEWVNGNGERGGSSVVRGIAVML